MSETWPKVRLFIKDERGDVVCEKFAGLGAFQARFGFGNMPGLTRYMMMPVDMGDVHAVRAELDVIEYLKKAPHCSQGTRGSGGDKLKEIFRDYFFGNEPLPCDTSVCPHPHSETRV